MLQVLVSLLATLRDSLRTRVGLQAEVIALRHQVFVLQRRNQKRRLQLSAFDRLLWVWLSRIWVDWKSALRIVKPTFAQIWSAILGEPDVALYPSVLHAKSLPAATVMQVAPNPTLARAILAHAERE